MVRRRRPFRGTMVVHAGPATELPFVRSERERREERKVSRRSKRRFSLGDSPRTHSAARRTATSPRSVYEVLLAVLFATTHGNDRHAQEAFEVLAGFTSSKTHRLDEDAIVTLEEVFNVLVPSFDHLFLDFVIEVDVHAAAEEYLDLPFLVRVVEHVVQSHVTPTTPKDKVREVMAPLKYLHKVLGRAQRRRSVG